MSAMKRLKSLEIFRHLQLEVDLKKYEAETRLRARKISFAAKHIIRFIQMVTNVIARDTVQFCLIKLKNLQIAI